MNARQTAREFLKERIIDDVRLIGNVTPEKIKSVTDAWLDDKVMPAGRYAVIRRYFPDVKTVLDMASGAGGFVFYGLQHGFDVQGIEPEPWKSTLIEMKISENGYSPEWAKQFHTGVGEKMPFSDNSFDFVSTYQTLEHVQDVQACINEMIRVTKPGGVIHIQCPNYLSTFEPHYELPWLPLFPRKWARKYLELCGANPAYLDTINYTTPFMLRRMIGKAQAVTGKTVMIENLEKRKFKETLVRKKLGFLQFMYPLYVAFSYTKNLFRSVNDIHLLVTVGSI